MLYDWEATEYMFVSEIKELEKILWSRSKDMENRLKEIRREDGKSGDLRSRILLERRANSTYRISAEAKRVQARLMMHGEETRLRVKE